MCGPETSNRPRGGALVALTPPLANPTSPLRGDLTFHTPDRPGSAEATHARLTPENPDEPILLGPLHIIIHSTGDLSKSADECGLFRRIYLPSGALEFSLEQPLSLQVGDEGIIGRRVSLYSRDGADVVAEGVVGFNFDAL